MSVGVRAPLIEGEEFVWPFTLAAPACVSLVGYNSVFSFHVDVVSGDGHRCPMPALLWQRRRRLYRRVRIAPADALRFGGRPVRDLSPAGLSIAFDPKSDHFDVGTVLESWVLQDDTRSMKLAALVVGVSYGRDEAIAHLSVNLPSASPSQRGEWCGLVDARMNPLTRTTGDAATLWSVYERSGYFDLSGKNSAQFEPLRASFGHVAAAVESRPALGCHVILPSSVDGAAAALSAMRVYSRSWLGFQMAKAKGDTAEGVSSRTALREIHLRTYEHIQLHGAASWIIAYPQVKPVWSRMVHHDLPQRYVERGEAAVVRFQAIELAASRASREETAAVGPASSGENQLLLQTLHRTRSAPYLDALDLSAQTLDLHAVRNAWSEAGLSRERIVLVARDRAQPVAAAVAELASDGAHLFRLMDLVRLYPLATNGDSYYPVLLRAAGDWFARNGKSSFVVMRESGTDIDFAELPVIQDMGLADMTILAAQRIPELLEYLVQVTAPRPKAYEPPLAHARPPGRRNTSIR